MQHRSLRLLALCAVAAGTFGQTKPPAKAWTAPKTAWGDPDLQGVWTSDDFYGVPFERPEQYGDRKFLTDEEYAARAKETDLLATSVQAGVYPNAGYFRRRPSTSRAAVHNHRSSGNQEMEPGFRRGWCAQQYNWSELDSSRSCSSVSSNSDG